MNSWQRVAHALFVAAGERQSKMTKFKNEKNDSLKIITITVEATKTLHATKRSRIDFRFVALSNYVDNTFFRWDVVFESIIDFRVFDPETTCGVTMSMYAEMNGRNKQPGTTAGDSIGPKRVNDSQILV